MKLLIALAVTLLSATAHAQTWWVQPNTTPPNGFEFALLPYSVTFDMIPSTDADQWYVPNGATWVPVWPRNAAGAWYRPNPYTQFTAIQNPVYPWSYKCVAVGGYFKCTDGRGIVRTVNCPTSLYVGPLKLWRTMYNSAWPEQGLYTGNVGPFSANTGRRATLTGSVVTDNGKQINCKYGNLTSSGVGTTLDIWVFRR